MRLIGRLLVFPIGLVLTLLVLLLLPFFPDLLHGFSSEDIELLSYQKRFRNDAHRSTGLSSEMDTD